LGSMRAWISSSEPVLADSFEQFVARFGAHGVRREALAASYAMAENVYAATQTRLGRHRTVAIDPREFRERHVAVPLDGAGGLPFVSNGPVVEGTSLRVLDDAGAELPGGHFGELALSGDYTFDGYFRRADLTAAALTPDGWFRTGDLGFVHDGEVFVT